MLYKCVTERNTKENKYILFFVFGNVVPYGRIQVSANVYCLPFHIFISIYFGNIYIYNLNNFGYEKDVLS